MNKRKRVCLSYLIGFLRSSEQFVLQSSGALLGINGVDLPDDSSQDNNTSQNGQNNDPGLGSAHTLIIRALSRGSAFGTEFSSVLAVSTSAAALRAFWEFNIGGVPEPVVITFSTQRSSIDWAFIAVWVLAGFALIGTSTGCTVSVTLVAFFFWSEEETGLAFGTSFFIITISASVSTFFANNVLLI